MGNPWATHEQPMANQWNGQPMANPWPTHGQPIWPTHMADPNPQGHAVGNPWELTSMGQHSSCCYEHNRIGKPWVTQAKTVQSNLFYYDGRPIMTDPWDRAPRNQTEGDARWMSPGFQPMRNVFVALSSSSQNNIRILVAL